MLLNALKFVAFALCALCLVLYAGYTQAQKSHFYENNASMDFSYVTSGADFTPQSSLITSPTKAVHSSTLVQTPLGVMALFFGGSREGARDVAIYQSFYDEHSKSWSAPQSILDAPTLSKMSGKFIKKLGNPVAFRDKAGKAHFFVVGVSLGGWATSKIYQLEFDENLKPKFKGELKLGAFANLSHLVRTPAITLDNGGFILPFYHELARKYPMIAFFDERANLLYTKRLNALKNELQPSVIVDDAGGAEFIAFFRNHKAYDSTAFLQRCFDKGNHCATPTATNLKSYDSSSVLGLILTTHKGIQKSEVLLIHNDGGKENPRSKLSLFWLKNEQKGEFVKLFTIDEGAEVSYPALLMPHYNELGERVKGANAPNFNALDKMYISYTLDRKHIKMQALSVKAIQRAIDEKRGEK